MRPTHGPARRCPPFIRMVGSLLFGAFATIAVAWTSVVFASWKNMWRPLGWTPTAKAIPWMWSPPPDWSPPTHEFVTRAPGCENTDVSHLAAIMDDDAHSQVEIMVQRRRRAGWPLLALESRDQFPTSRPWQPRYFTSRTWFNSWAQGLGATDPDGAYIVLPLVPRVPHFIISTLFYAALPQVSLAAIRRGRRAVRLRADRCPTCGYAVSNLPTCPECGAALQASAAHRVNNPSNL